MIFVNFLCKQQSRNVVTSGNLSANIFGTFRFGVSATQSALVFITFGQILGSKMKAVWKL